LRDRGYKSRCRDDGDAFALRRLDSIEDRALGRASA
jgi:hypothetical protein